MILIQPWPQISFLLPSHPSPLHAPDQAYHLWKLSLHCPNPNHGRRPYWIFLKQLLQIFLSQYLPHCGSLIAHCTSWSSSTDLKMNHFRQGRVLSALLVLVLSTVLGTEWLCGKCWWKESLSVYVQILKQMCSWHMGDTFCLCDNWQLSLLGSRSTQLKTNQPTSWRQLWGSPSGLSPFPSLSAWKKPNVASFHFLHVMIMAADGSQCTLLLWFFKPASNLLFCINLFHYSSHSSGLCLVQDSGLLIIF